MPYLGLIALLVVLGTTVRWFWRMWRVNIPKTPYLFQALWGAGFVLGINTLFAVAGIFVLRYRRIGEQSLYRTFAYPLTPIVYLSITLWTLTYILINRPLEGLVGLALISAGVLMYFISSRFGMTSSSVEQEISSNPF